MFCFGTTALSPWILFAKSGGATGVNNTAILNIYAQNRLRVANVQVVIAHKCTGDSDACACVNCGGSHLAGHRECSEQVKAVARYRTFLDEHA